MLPDDLNLIENTEKDCLKIYTLGHFEVKLDIKTLSDNCRRSQQVWNLFKYILTYRNKSISQENFFSILWASKECDNPIKALQNLVYRLRMILNYEATNIDGESIINYAQGCYNWNMNSHYWTDVDEFEELYKKAKVAQDNDDFIKAIELYQKSLLLYRGDYLCEDLYNEWITPIRNYYRRIYMDIIDKITSLLKHYGRNQDILKVCEDALMIQPFEESLHLLFIEALIEDGNIKQAQEQYQYVTTMLYKELGVKPSTDLRNLYRQIKCNDDTILLGLNSIQEMMMDRHDSDGAFFCEQDTFISFYKLECRRAERIGQVVAIAMISITRVKHRNQDSQLLKNVMGSLLDVLIQTLRKGDVVAKWSNTQILVLLTGTTFEQAGMVLNRILKKHEMLYTSNDIVVETLLEPLKSLDL